MAAAWGQGRVRGVTGSAQDLEIVVISTVIAKLGVKRVSFQHGKLEKRSETGQVSPVCTHTDTDI